MVEITGIILAGGKSTRMGTDKGLMNYNGKPMIEHVLAPMSEVCSRVLIITSNEEYAQFGHQLVKDELTDYGPVMGILSGLRQSKTDLNLILSCDTPNVTQALMELLKDEIRDHDVSAASSSTGIHPLIAVYHKRTMSTFEQAVGAGEHRLRSVISKLNVAEVEVENELIVKNLNRPEDLQG